MKILILFMPLILWGCQTIETKPHTATVNQTPLAAPTPFKIDFAAGKVTREWLDKRDAAIAAINDGRITRGTHKLKVQEYWGQPDRTGTTETDIIDWYDSPNQPIFFRYSRSDGKLKSTADDTETLEKYKTHRRFLYLETRIEILESQLRQTRADQTNQAIQAEQSAGWQSLGNALNNYNQQNQMDQMQRQQFYQQQQINQMKSPQPSYHVPLRK